MARRCKLCGDFVEYGRYCTQCLQELIDAVMYEIEDDLNVIKAKINELKRAVDDLAKRLTAN